MVTLLAVLSAVAVVAFLLVLAALAIRIASTLESIGNREPSIGHQGHMSFLAKISLGVRAIEVETSQLPPQVTKLNQNLQPLAAGLIEVRDKLASIRKRVQQQKG